MIIDESKIVLMLSHALDGGETVSGCVDAMSFRLQDAPKELLR
jgi:hypothetical protein